MSCKQEPFVLGTVTVDGRLALNEAFVTCGDSTIDIRGDDAPAIAARIMAGNDLLAALEYLVAHCKGMDRFEGNPINQAIADARAAIAKAKGSTS